MEHNILNSEVIFDTDLAMERRRADSSCEGIRFERKSDIIGEWECITVSSEEAEKEIIDGFLK